MSHLASRMGPVRCLGFAALLAMPLMGCKPPTPAPKPVAAKPSPPPQFWSIESEGGTGHSHAIRMCADEHIRSGFTAFSFTVGNTPCVPRSINVQGQDRSYRCKIGDSQFGVATTVSGASDTAFSVASTVTALDEGQTLYSRVLKFKHIGPCPTGWKIGQATNQKGERVVAAFLEDTNLPYVPQW